LKQAAQLCEQGHFSALVTAPVHKANINAAGIPFTGHTEFFAEYFKAPQVVMMLACEKMRVALVTTHLPLSKVATTITYSLVVDVIKQLQLSLIRDFGITDPVIKVAGLNPHAGESGYLGREEIQIIQPALSALQKQGMNIQGPYPADTMFVKNSERCDAYVAMYHDQGLPVLKYAGFNHSVNITLGLPIIRTSVDHGTALDLAGTNKVDAGSLLMAVRTAMSMTINRAKK
jgi:4-hydroxythreonine-4-phosphate dehydrogenase